jgi:hypothetical protein
MIAISGSQQFIPIYYYYSIYQQLLLRTVSITEPLDVKLLFLNHLHDIRHLDYQMEIVGLLLQRTEQTVQVLLLIRQQTTLRVLNIEHVKLRIHRFIILIQFLHLSLIRNLATTNILYLNRVLHRLQQTNRSLRQCKLILLHSKQSFQRSKSSTTQIQHQWLTIQYL